MNLDDLERALGHTFSDRTHLLEALTHKTWLMEQQARGLALDLRDQQRLEFLGDAFLNYEVGRLLFLRFPKASEGDLTARRRSLVKGESIHAVGQRLGVLDLVQVGAGERVKLDRNKKVLEDTVEALIGAILLDASEAEAREVVGQHFSVETLQPAEENSISAFNQRWQKLFRESPPKPNYSSSGPADAQTWTAEVTLPGGGIAVGVGTSQPEARRAACARALEWMDDAE